MSDEESIMADEDTTTGDESSVDSDGVDSEVYLATLSSYVNDFKGVAKVLQVFICRKLDVTPEDYKFVTDLAPRLSQIAADTNPTTDEMSLVFHLFVDLIEQTSAPEIAASTYERFVYVPTSNFLCDVLQAAKHLVGARHLTVHKLYLMKLFLKPASQARAYASFLVSLNVLVYMEEEGHILTGETFQLQRSGIEVDEPYLDLDDNAETDPIRDIRYAYATAMLLRASVTEESDESEEPEDSLFRAASLLEDGLYSAYLCIPFTRGEEDTQDRAYFRYRRSAEKDLACLTVSLYQNHAAVLLLLKHPEASSRALTQMTRCVMFEIHSKRLLDLNTPYVNYLNHINFDRLSPNFIQDAWCKVDYQIPDVKLQPIVTHVLAQAEMYAVTGERDGCVTAVQVLHATITGMFSRMEQLYGSVANMTGASLDDFKIMVHDVLRARLVNALRVTERAPWYRKTKGRVTARMNFLEGYLKLMFNKRQPFYNIVLRDILIDAINIFCVDGPVYCQVSYAAADFMHAHKAEFLQSTRHVSLLASEVAYRRGNFPLFIVYHADHVYEDTAVGAVPDLDDRLPKVIKALAKKVDTVAKTLPPKKRRDLKRKEDSIIIHLHVMEVLRRSTRGPQCSVPSLQLQASKVVAAQQTLHVGQLQHLLQDVPMPCLEDIQSI